jgi:hypothetical protein
LGLDPERKAVAGVGPASGRRSRASRAMGVDAGGDGSLRVEKTVESTAICKKELFWMRLP